VWIVDERRDETTTPLPQQMIRAMRQRGFSVRTHHSYLVAVSALARYHGRSPADLDVGQLQTCFNPQYVEQHITEQEGAQLRVGGRVVWVVRRV
jgi:hypothetical protein